MTLTTGTAGPLLTPEQVESLLIKPVLAASMALNPLCSRVLRPTAPSVRLPPVTADPTAAWVAEGARRSRQRPRHGRGGRRHQEGGRSLRGYLGAGRGQLPGGHRRGGAGPGSRYRPEGRRGFLR